MRKKINLTEARIRNVIRGVINEMFGEAKIAYNPNFLNGINSIDARSINYFIQAMIPLGNRVSKNSPYKGLRQLVLFFSEDGASKHGGAIAKDVVRFILKDDALRTSIKKITDCDAKIIDLIYGTNKLSGKPLMQQIVWNLDEIIEELIKFNDLIDKSNIKNYFGGMEAIDGSEDGRRLGLSGIMYHAFTGIDEIKKQIKRMQEILDKGNDPFSYRWKA